MRRLAIAALMVFGMIGLSHARTTVVTFKGGLMVTSTSGCEERNPDKRYFQGTYELPIGGSPQGFESTISFLSPSGSADAFTRPDDVLNAAYMPVKATRVFTGVKTFTAYARIGSQVPASITADTQSLYLTGSIKNWGDMPDCVVNFAMALVKDLRAR